MRPYSLALLTVIAALVPVAPAAARGPGAPPVARTQERVPTAPRAVTGSAAAVHNSSPGRVKALLRSPMRAAGSRSGALVVDLSNNRTVFRLRSSTRRNPASVEKLYTTSTALLRYGPNATLNTTVLGDGTLDGTTFRGNLYLRGAGDPTFGSRSFSQDNYGTGATTLELARRLRAVGVQSVRGRIYGDDRVFDRFRGVPDSGLRSVSPYVGPLSGLSYDRGGGAAFAARALKVALKGRDVPVSGKTGAKVTPAGARALASVQSPSVSKLVSLTNRPSDNFFAEMLIKGLGARFGAAGSTAAGARVVRTTVARFGAQPEVVDGSGLSREDRTSPSDLIRLLDGIRSEPAVALALRASLPVAGESGTLRTRMRGTAADGRCSAKTGTLSNVSALAGYCTTRGGQLVAFAFLMTRVSVSSARDLQDRMVTSIARYDASAD